MLNRRMPSGMYGGVRGEKESPLLDCVCRAHALVSKFFKDGFYRKGLKASASVLIFSEIVAEVRGFRLVQALFQKVR